MQHVLQTMILNQEKSDFNVVLEYVDHVSQAMTSREYIQNWRLQEMKEKGSYTQQSGEEEELKSFIKGMGVDLVGIADLHSLKGMPLGIPSDAGSFLSHYHCAIVMGAQLDKLGKNVPGKEVSLFLERAALAVVDRLERKKRRVLTVHTEDEFDPVNRVGLMSLKVLAKAAGLGWQGRSLLIVSPLQYKD